MPSQFPVFDKALSLLMSSDPSSAEELEKLVQDYKPSEAVQPTGRDPTDEPGPKRQKVTVPLRWDLC